LGAEKRKPGRVGALVIHKQPTATHQLYLASANPGKLREFQAAAAPLGFDVRTLPRFCQLAPCVEDGATFEANARKKATYYSAFTDGLLFADDSGICVDALGGAPGVFSARFAGAIASDEENNRKLIEELHRLDIESGLRPAPTTRAAHYVCVIALAQQGEIRTVVEGSAHGIIIDDPRGSRGFGYDPYFFFPPLGKTFAELTAEQKHVVSHRGAAFRALLEFLKTFQPR
jgi:XTP/dITP diphosphohydrolase